MAGSYGETLAAALAEMAEEAPALRPLSPIARQRVREGRRRAVAAAVAAIVGICAAGAATIVGVSHVTATRPPSSPGPPRSWSVDASSGVDAVAAGPKTLYVATGDYPNGRLSAFSIATGTLIRSIHVPAATSELRVGPGGTVWLAFSPDQNGGQTGVWILSPDLRLRSSAGTSVAEHIGLVDLLPIGPSWAAVVNSSLSELTLPSPGQPGSVKLRAIVSIPSDGNSYMQALALMHSGFAVLELTDRGEYRVVMAGSQPAVQYQTVTGMEVTSMTSDGPSLWVAETPQLNGPYNGAVVRLNDRLQVVTPPAVARSRLLRFPQQIWNSGATVVVSTDGPDPLVCFRSSGAGPVTRIPLQQMPADLAVSGRNIYAVYPDRVRVYPIPAACQ
ncbi:MAG TPA: hypothetical protein VEV61_08990 [Streptosporangiaceae bacterium]|nr:hypothetical protein [Streptosporangiaceae bacterium]